MGEAIINIPGIRGVPGRNAPEIKERLSAFSKARNLYEQAKEESEQIATMLTSAAIDYSRVRVQSSPKDFTDTMARLVDLHAECVKRMEACVQAMEDTKGLIDLVTDPKSREILSRRYLRCQHWNDIEEDTGKDYRWLFRLHDRGLQEIKERLG